MGKTLKQHTSYRSNHKKGSAITGKIANQEARGIFPAPVNSHVKELPALQIPSTHYIIVQINQDLATLAEQKKPTAKAEEAKAMFAKYRASK